MLLRSSLASEKLVVVRIQSTFDDQGLKVPRRTVSFNSHPVMDDLMRCLKQCASSCVYDITTVM